MTFKGFLIFTTVVAFGLVVGTSFAQDTGGGASVTSSVPAGATQDQTPTTPEGEEQPPEQQPDGEQTPTTEENGGTQNAPSGEGGGTGGETAGALPQTGFQLVALTSIGLGLLLAGAALWPTSSWPPPRDRLSRSTTRRRPPPARRRPARP
jgi:hypothetical protein